MFGGKEVIEVHILPNSRGSLLVVVKLSLVLLPLGFEPLWQLVCPP